jgi:tetratricopeptide (TPR) repeat protein
LLLVPGFLVSLALRLHSSWRSVWSGVTASLALGAGVVLPLAWLLRTLGWALESGAAALVALETIPLAALYAAARSGRLGGFDALHGRGALEWCADAFVALAGASLAATFAIWIEPAMPGGDLWYYLSYIDWMATRPGLEYVPHSLDPEEWNPRLQSSGFLAFEAMLSRLVRIDANALEVYWSWLPLGLIPLTLGASYALAVSLGTGPLARAALVVTQLALVYATLPYVFDRATSGSRWPATVLLFRTSQDKVFLAALLAPAAAMFAAEWLARGHRRWLAALLATGVACVLTHPLGLPFLAMVTVPFAVVSALAGSVSWQRAAALALLLLPLLAWPLSQRADEGAPTTLADDAGFARREHLTRDSLRIASREDNRFTAHPSLVAHPLLVAGIICGVALLGFVRVRSDARYAFATTAAPLIMLYTPGIAPLAGLVVTPYLLWRFTWLLPIALSLAVAGSAVAALAARSAPRSPLAGPAAAAAFAGVVALATSLPGDLGRVREALGVLAPAPIPASSAASWVEPLRSHVGDETVLLDPSLQPLALSLAAGLQTGYWRSGSDPSLYARVGDFFGSRLLAPRHLELVRKLRARFVASPHDMPIGAALALRSELFEPVASFGELRLFRARDTAYTGAVPEPVDYWRERSRAEPGSAEARSRLSLALLEAGHHDEARRVLETSVARGDADAASFAQLGTLALQRGDYARARELLEQSVALDPAQGAARNNLVWLLATCPVEPLRDPEAAVRHARELLDAGSLDAGSLDTIAAAFAAAGDFDAALLYAGRSLVLYESAGAGQAALESIRARLDGYREGRAFVDVSD